ncbi:hypothetical protein I6E68_05540 [Salinibacterium sp. NSLL150]|uniref:hypothetical protein n=1 Tax=unclassified Salinibacterium TaxID=2632331 RepID=UPI0018CFBB69|nr:MULTISPECIES: hypothetical protein [unclassified Salinibacterium]MBH0098604.1 hypothetical protein [Salinibacterium sp. NSLL35]MBH0101359.1 hypothetical protein [Salinibacterium sp. NSLL150]MBH0104118.1 hypothetical protein [Salinibacterium sp. NSLL16]MBH0106879.1 hypothetical protein [Salinibacterium sp. NSLL17]
MSVAVESFYVGGVKSGALLRRVNADHITTLLAFQSPDGPLIQLEQTTWFARSPLEWTKFCFTDHSAGVETESTREKWVASQGSTLTAEFRAAIPSYLAHVLLASFLQTGAESRDFSQFAEGTPNVVVAARFVRGATEEILVGSNSTAAQKVLLELAGHATNTFWVDGQSILKSDWNGAESYPAPTLDDALDGLSTPIVEIVTAFAHAIAE